MTARNKVRPLSATIEAFRFTFLNIPALLSGASVTITVYCVAVAGLAAWPFFYGPVKPVAVLPFSPNSLLWAIFWYAFLTALLVPLSIRWMRFYALGEELTERPAFPPGSARFFFLLIIISFLSYSVFLSSVFVLIGEQLLMAISHQETAIFRSLLFLAGIFIIVFLIATRCLFILPGIALHQHRYRLGDAWNHTSGNALRISLGAFLIFLLVVLTTMLLSASLYSGDDPSPDIMSLLIATLTSIVTNLAVALVGSAYYAHVFKELVSEDDVGQFDIY